MASKHIQFRSDSRLEEHFQLSTPYFVRNRAENTYNNFVIPIYQNNEYSKPSAIDGWKQSSDRLNVSKNATFYATGTIFSDSTDTLLSENRTENFYVNHELRVRSITGIDQSQARQKSLTPMESSYSRQHIVKAPVLTSHPLEIEHNCSPSPPVSNEVYHKHYISSLGVETVPTGVVQQYGTAERRFDSMTKSLCTSIHLSPPGSFHSEDGVPRKGLARNQYQTSSLRNEHGRIQLFPSITRKQLHRSMSDLGFGKLQSYKKLEVIGEGTYATVYKGYSNLLKRMVALKEIKMEKTEGAPCTAIREISILRSLRHANIVTLHDVIFTDNCLTLVFEYAGTDLRRFMKHNRYCLAMSTVKLFLLQIFRALAFCHARQIVHRDLKPQNLLVNEKNEVKLADFGLARTQSIPTKSYSTEVATLWYRPPDVLLGDRTYAGDIDIWGAGCILYELTTGHALFPGKSQEDQIWIIFEKIGIPPEQYWPGLHQIETFRKVMRENSVNREYSRYNVNSADLSPSEFLHRMRSTLKSHVIRLDTAGIDLLVGCLEPLGSRRITALQALSHDFFNGVLPTGIKVDALSPLTSLVTLARSDETGRSVSQYRLSSHFPNAPGLGRTDTQLARSRLQAVSVDDLRINSMNKENTFRPVVKEPFPKLTATKQNRIYQQDQNRQQTLSNMSNSPPQTFVAAVGPGRQPIACLQSTQLNPTSMSPSREMQVHSRAGNTYTVTSRTMQPRGNTLPFVVESNYQYQHLKYPSSPRPYPSIKRPQSEEYNGRYYNSLDKKSSREISRQIVLREPLVPYTFRTESNHHKGQTDRRSSPYDSFSRTNRHVGPHLENVSSLKKEDYISTYPKYNGQPTTDVSQFKPHASLRKSQQLQKPLRVYHIDPHVDSPYETEDLTTQRGYSRLPSQPDRAMVYSKDTISNEGEQLPNACDSLNSLDYRKGARTGLDRQYASRYPTEHAGNTRARLSEGTPPVRVILVKQTF